MASLIIMDLKSRNIIDWIDIEKILNNVQKELTVLI